jgi:hypothetical protein
MSGSARLKFCFRESAVKNSKLLLTALRPPAFKTLTRTAEGASWSLSPNLRNFICKLTLSQLEIRSKINARLSPVLKRKQRNLPSNLRLLATVLRHAYQAKL